jgi:hypothetical protein
MASRPKANMLLATWMTLVGPAPTLLGAKMLAAIVAIGPWILILGGL